MSSPPRMSPIAPPPIDTAVYQPIARTRSCPSGNMVISSASADGAANAPPTPWSARAASSQPLHGATPPRNDATVKTAMPAMNTLRRPSRSPARAPSSRKPPKASVYAVMTQERFAGDRWSAEAIPGRAMFTIVASSTTINWTARMTPSTRPRRTGRRVAGRGGAINVAVVGMKDLHGVRWVKRTLPPVVYGGSLRFAT